MAETKPQTYANHTRWDPPFHFFIAPVFVLGLILTLIHFFAHITHGDMRDHIHAFLLILLAAALLTFVFKMRLYSLRSMQDRVIRLEERLRLTQLLSEPLALADSGADGRSTVWAAFRDLMRNSRNSRERAMNEKMSRADIKKAIQTWRPDYWRV